MKKKKKRKKKEAFRVLKYCIRGFEICNVEGSLKGGKKKKVEALRYCVRKQRVWKLPIFLLYRFSVTAVYLISFLPLFLSTRFINSNRTSLLWLRYLYISILFFGCKTFILYFNSSSFLGAKLLCFVYINMRRSFFFFFFRLFVFILGEHP